MRNPGVALVIRTALDAAAGLPIRERALLYRGLAEICGSETSEAAFLQVAEKLESADAALSRATLDLFPE